MDAHAEGTLEIGSWDEQPLAEIDAERKLTTTNVTQKVRGDIEGEGSATWLAAYRADGTAEYLGFQRIDGRIGDAEGSIVLRMTGGYDGTIARSEWEVVDGTGTGRPSPVCGAGRSAKPRPTAPRRTRSTTRSGEHARLRSDREPSRGARAPAHGSDAARGHRRRCPVAVGGGRLSTIERFFVDGPTIDDLRRVLGLTSSGVVRLVDQLEDEGWVARRRGEDGRVTVVVLTPQGRRRAREVVDARADVLVDALAGLSRSERDTSAHLVDKVLVGLVRGPSPGPADAPGGARPRCAGPRSARRAVPRDAVPRRGDQVIEGRSDGSTASPDMSRPMRPMSK